VGDTTETVNSTIERKREPPIDKCASPAQNMRIKSASHTNCEAQQHNERFSQKKKHNKR